MAKKKVKNTTTVSSKVSNPNHPLTTKPTITFDFSYSGWLKSVKRREFTNMLRDDSQFAEFLIQLFTKIIPTVQYNWNTIKTNAKYQFPHCHTISQDKISEVDQITYEIHGKALRDEMFNDELNYWQLGISQSLRVIALYNHYNNTMYPLFLDYHHELHPSINHNQDDIYAYNYCPYHKFS
ncbi:hypothetical protein [Paenibacillus sp. 481]|uniref:hypothetical protein n=1 Tax=Paenibacillus sp. 481 TaxID=2835869 RepID=UPI001E5A5E31|nr:hypothetical protein [Paenibacillus sp. 481]UHA74966.1 hypothetical protein KIK04_08025 [Paenibacillus sp. 481]